MEFGEEDLPEEYIREAKDVLKQLRRRDVIRTRSMSPNFVRRTHRRTAIIQQESDESEAKENPAHVHLEDLPCQELEGAPPGWGSNRRGQNSISNTFSQQMPPQHRRNSAFPATGLRVEMRRSSAVGRRRESQMTFDEWCQLKKFQELHESALKHHEGSATDLEHEKNMKKNISYDEWSKATEKRQRRTAEEFEKLKIKTEKEKEAMGMAKYRRKISYDKWMEEKNKTTDIRTRKISDVGPSTFHMHDERRKKSEEAHQKWVIKKELAQLQKDRQQMLRKSSLKTSELPTL